MFTTSVPKPIRFLVMLSAAFLVASLVMTGVNAYVVLASPLRQQQQPYAPKTITFEGYLADTGGAPINDPHDLTFSVYDALTAGSSVWTQQSPGVSIANGLYSVQLGSDANPLTPSIFSDKRWLEIKVDNVAMSPRVAINAVPWALNAVNAQQAQGLQGNAVSSAAPANGNALVWNGTTSQWEPQGISGNATSLQGRSIDSTTPTVNQGLVWNGSAWAPADVNALKLQNQAVSSAAPTSGQALIWNSTTSQWEPQGISGNATSLQNRPIDGTAPTSGQALVWNGSSWIPAVVDASKLQGNAVSSTTPTSGQALIWDGSQWVPRAAMLSDLAAVGSDASPQSLLVNYQQGAGLSYSDTANFKVSAGELVITDINGNNSKLRRNGTDTTVGLAASLDAGTPATNTTYYVYAVADGTGPSFTIATSTSSTQPSGKTNYRKIGWLRTALDSNQIATVGDYGLNNGSGALAAIIKPRATLSNSAAETTIFTTTVPAGTFAAGNQVNLRLWYDYTNGTGVTQTITYKVKLGSTTALTLTKNLSAYGGYIDVTVMGNGTNSQTVGLVYTDSGANNNAGLFGASRLGSATENASNALDLSVTAKFSTASTLLTLDTKGGTLLAPYWPK